MREALKHVFSNQIVLEDKSRYFYTIKPYELTNVLGHSVAVLQEYDFTKQEEGNAAFSCKLYKTKEGNWYETGEIKTAVEKHVVRMLKSAIDAKENNTVLE